MIQLMIYGAMILGFVAAVWAGVAHVEGIGEKKQLAIDQPKIIALTADVKTATDANASLQLDLSKLGEERKACSDSVVGYELQTAAAIGRRVVAEQKANATRGALEADRDMAVRFALAPRPPGQTCEQTLGNMDKQLRDLAKREFAERPPAAPDPAAKPQGVMGVGK